MVRVLTPGRSKYSHLLVATRHVHLFAWTPLHGADSFGVTVRWRRGRDWQHMRMILFQRNPRRGYYLRNRAPKRVQDGQKIAVRRTLTIAELSGWTTANGTTERDGMKSYLRLKAGPSTGFHLGCWYRGCPPVGTVTRKPSSPTGDRARMRRALCACTAASGGRSSALGSATRTRTTRRSRRRCSMAKPDDVD